MFSKGAIDFINRKAAGMEMLLLNYAGKMEKEAKAGAKWIDRTSHARQGINGSVEKQGVNNDFKVYLAHGVEYGQHLEEGTAPHIIKPTNSKALYWAGAAHPVKSVQHPGTKAYPILETTLHANKHQLAEDILKWWTD